MKADEEVKMIKPDALVLVVKATELFIGQFIKDAYVYTKQEKRKTVKFRDLEKVVRDMEVYDFLTTDENILRKGTEEPAGKRLRLDPETGAEEPEDETLGESDHDFWLPISNIKRVAKAKLNEVIPGDVKVNLEAAACVAIARAATIFISLITATALETCGKRSTLMTENIYQAIEEIEFQFSEALLAIEEQARNAPAADAEGGKPPKKKKALSGFFRFSMEKRADVKAMHPDASVSECAKILGKLWRELTDEQRLSYKVEQPEAVEDGAAAAAAAAAAADGATVGGAGDADGAAAAGGVGGDGGVGGGEGGSPSVGAFGEPGAPGGMDMAAAMGGVGGGMDMEGAVIEDENARRLAEDMDQSGGAGMGVGVGMGAIGSMHVGDMGSGLGDPEGMVGVEDASQSVVEQSSNMEPVVDDSSGMAVGSLPNVDALGSTDELGATDPTVPDEAEQQAPSVSVTEEPVEEVAAAAASEEPLVDSVAPEAAASDAAAAAAPEAGASDAAAAAASEAAVAAEELVLPPVTEIAPAADGM